MHVHLSVDIRPVGAVAQLSTNTFARRAIVANKLPLLNHEYAFIIIELR